MHVISIHQPWAWMIIHGDKDIENRPSSARVRDPVLVHASGGCTRRAYDEATNFAFLRHGGCIWELYPKYEELQRVGIVGQVQIAD